MSTSGLTRTVRETTKETMWVGTIADLRALVETAKHLAGRSHDELVAELTATEARRKAEWLTYNSHLSEAALASRWQERDERDRADILNRIPLTMTVILKAYGEELRGDPDVILPMLDEPGDVDSVRITLGSQTGVLGVPPHSGFRVLFTKSGAIAHIFGLSRDWSDVARHRLSESLGRQRPRYAWLRSFWATALFAILPITISLSIFAGLFTHGYSVNAGVGIGVNVTGVVLSWLAGFIAWPKVFPMFELHEASKTARGRITLGFISSAALWILGTIAIPLWLG